MMPQPPKEVLQKAAEINEALRVVDGVTLVEPCRPRLQPALLSQLSPWFIDGRVVVRKLGTLRQVLQLSFLSTSDWHRLPTSKVGADGSAEVIFIGSPLRRRVIIDYIPTPDQEPLHWQGWRWDHGLQYGHIVETRSEALAEVGLTERTCSKDMAAGAAVVFDW